MQARPEPKIAEWRLSEEKLKEMAVQAIDIRLKIDEKAVLHQGLLGSNNINENVLSKSLLAAPQEELADDIKLGQQSLCLRHHDGPEGVGHSGMGISGH